MSTKTYLKSSIKLFNNFKSCGLINKSTSSKPINIKSYLWKDYLSELKTLNYYNESIEYLEDEINYLEYNKMYNMLVEKHSQSLIRFRPEEEKEKYFFDYYMMVVLPLSSHIRYKNKKLNIKNNIIGVQAPQGSGKTTLCEMLGDTLDFIQNIENGSNSKTLVISSDDFYLGYNDLERIKVSSPHFKFRGPPGTHETPLIKQVFNGIKSNNEFEIPKYDKTLYNGKGDRKTNLRANKNTFSGVIFEGWFNGIKSVEVTQLFEDTKSRYPPSEVERIFKIQQEINQILKNNYEPLWNEFDHFILIKPEKYEYSREWRIQTEVRKGGMSIDEINKFVDYFWETVPPYVYFKNMLNESYRLSNKVKPLIIQCDLNREYFI